MSIATTCAPAVPARAAVLARIPWGFPEVFVISQTLLPALLYLPGSQGFRLWLRVAAFLISLAALGWWLLRDDDHGAPHPARGWLLGGTVVLGLMLLHPLTPSLLGGAAHLTLYVAVIAPVFWSAAMVKTPEHLARLLGLILICSGVNATVGVLQVYDAARWMPPEFSRVITEGAIGLGPVMYPGPDGRMIIRPPGLFDTPGAVAGPGMFAALLGAVFGLSALAPWKRAVSFAFAAAGVAAIYLSQVRVSLVVLLLMVAAYIFVLLRQHRPAKATAFGLLASTVLVSAFGVAVALGGASVSQRVLTLIQGDPLALYYNARGVQLNYTFTELIAQFPFGAGLARWGMAAAYFGASASDAIWAEIQITGWMIDGGIPLTLLYVGALVVTGSQHLRLATTGGQPRLAACAAVVFAANLGIAAMTLSFTPFVTQIGLQYWFLAGALHGVARHQLRGATDHGSASR